MNKKSKIKILCIFITFGLCFPLHYLYDLFPNFISSIFLPVNESIWEHMKLIFTSYLICEIIECFILRRKKIMVNNYYLQLLIVPIIGIIIYLILFLPLYNIFGENLFISLTLLFIIICLEHYLSIKLFNKANYKYEKKLGIIGIIIVYAIFTYLTYYPFNTLLFYDTINKGYGIISSN